MSESLSEVANVSEAPAPEAGAPAPEATPTPAEGGALAALADDPNDLSWVPEKYTVKGEDGEVDVKATLRKVTEAHGHLEKKLGSGEVPPKSVDEYKLNFGEVDEEAVKAFVNDEGIKSFIGEAHKLGFTNEQLNFVLNSYVASVQPPEVELEQMKQNTLAELKKTWGSQADYKANFQAADRALTAYADDADKGAINEILKSPVMVRILANVGKSLSEGAAPQMATIAPQDFDSRLAELKSSEAYMNTNHPQHKVVLRQVEELFVKRFGSALAN